MPATAYQKTTDFQLIPNQAPGQSTTLQLGSTTGADTNDPQPYLEDSGRRNLLVFSEPLIANLGLKTAGVTQASFTEAGLTNGAQFPAVAQLDYAYLTNFTCVNSTTYTISVYVVMNDGSAPQVGGSGDPTKDLSLVIGGAANSGAIAATLVSGSLYRVSFTSTSASWTAATQNGVIHYAAQSGKAFRVTGFQLEIGPTMTAYQPVGASYPTKTAVMGFVTDDYILSPTIPQLSMSGDWTVYLCGKFDGTLTNSGVFSVADPTSATVYQWVACHGSGLLFTASSSGGASTDITVPTTVYCVVRVQRSGTTLNLARLDTGASTSVASTAIAATPRIGLAAMARTTIGNITDSLKLALPVLLYARATTSSEDARIYRWYKDKAGQIGLPIL